MTIVIPLLLSAIASVETGGNAAKIGKAGERSAYQMTAETWRMHAKADEPFALASAPDGVLAAHVAESHVIYLARELERAGVPVTVQNVAFAWNSGATRAIRGILHGQEMRPDSYSVRVANLYNDALAHQPSTIPAHLGDLRLPTPPKYPEP